jgi:hypothetical protein
VHRSGHHLSGFHADLPALVDGVTDRNYLTDAVRSRFSDGRPPYTHMASRRWPPGGAVTEHPPARSGLTWVGIPPWITLREPM